eukprot:CAMPEP_0195281222 /NCGR_PEP_ID=MMETSP0707-20130614/630_1 /TAXON_ID=33640 /ORGANISM="Asterionellopsis glacialis, Strain CCMP134" /LENGTH=825 /DNA_ID=CAMNT_0040340091 /DNA_START=188 /DNA_END=2665 /DNA_ORIENTATION=-
MRHNRGAMMGAAAAAAASVPFLLALTETTNLADVNEQDGREEKSVVNESPQLNCSNQTPHHHTTIPNKMAVWTQVPPLHQEMCQCDSAATTATRPQYRPLSRLARHRTIKRMEDTSTQVSLRSRYEGMDENPVGEGAYGAVYMAKDRQTKENVAIKKMTKEFTDDKQFQREMDALLHIRESGGHPHICELRENFDEDGYYYLVLDLVSGGEMFDHLVKLGAYSEADAARLIREVASALAFLHGIGVIHGDLKPENLMLSTENPSDSVIKIVDFGCAQVETDESQFWGIRRRQSPNSNPNIGNTPAYSPPEALGNNRRSYLDASMDMWSLGIILYIMLTGLHPFDLNGRTSDEEIEEIILRREEPPLINSPLTAHLSQSSIDLIQRLMAWNPNDRMTALELLEHPWVNGAATKDKIAGSDKKLKLYRKFKTTLEAKVFSDIVSWSDHIDVDSVAKRTSLIERSFRSFDTEARGYVLPEDFRKLTGGGKSSKLSPVDKENENAPLSLSDYSNMLAENMINKHFPKGHTIYCEGEQGNHMYFINSGTVQVSTKDGCVSKRRQGDFFGEGALLHPKKIRSGTIKCLTPVHAIEISREYFDKYLANSIGTKISLREKDKTRKRNRAKTILAVQNNLQSRTFQKGEYLYKRGEEGKELFILEDGKVDVLVDDHCVFTVDKPGNLCGEHALVMGRTRYNTSAICTSDNCKMQVMKARDFYKLMDHSHLLKETLREICLRREFQKALVFRIKKNFPSANIADLKEAFDAADEDHSTKISLDNVRSMLKMYDPMLNEKEIAEILESLDLDQTGQVSFDEFKTIFGMDEARASAM